MRIYKGDKVQIISGKYRGKTGVVEKVFAKRNRVMVPGINVVKKHRRPRGSSDPGGIIEKAAPFDISKIMLICAKCNQPTKVGYKIAADEKMRFCKKCGGKV